MWLLIILCTISINDIEYLCNLIKEKVLQTVITIVAME